jgi:hypothetical protein
MTETETRAAVNDAFENLTAAEAAVASDPSAENLRWLNDAQELWRDWRTAIQERDWE